MKRLIICLVLLALPAFADEGIHRPPMEKIPTEVRPFVAKGTILLYLVGADLNGDGLKDFVLVLEKQNFSSADSKYEMPRGERPLLILVRQPDGTLKEVKRNENIIFCSTCGGVFGDPFSGITADKKTFTVSHYGGSADRWGYEYTFNYSRRDKTWQLVKVVETSHNIHAPEKGSSTTYTPPKDYGKIDIADFDPENWKGKGPK